ncbi:hypothetical protein MRX96_021151 [Rhipicephalus microplus]
MPRTAHLEEKEIRRRSLRCLWQHAKRFLPMTRFYDHANQHHIICSLRRRCHLSFSRAAGWKHLRNTISEQEAAPSVASKAAGDTHESKLSEENQVSVALPVKMAVQAEDLCRSSCRRALLRGTHARR